MQLLVVFVLVCIQIVLGYPGGWSPIPITDANVIAAANFVVHQKPISKDSSGSFRIISAQYQVVAGMNYEVILNVTSDMKCKVYRAVVFKSLAGKLTLTTSEKIKNKCT
mmetsp:Transcript_23198/g.31775  ORF Transcript_23198/g.31775 Transcript_23198/m.31775 type:complete len:109 (+) Transcript_23198:50-376(+)